MKITYRDSYIATMDKAMWDQLLLLPNGGELKGKISAESIIATVEAQTNRRFTKKAAKWFYDKLQAELT